MLVNQSMTKWDFCMLPTATDTLYVCTRVQMHKCMYISELPGRDSPTVRGVRD